jgi:hypothetical protein
MDRGNGPETRPKVKPFKRGCSPNLPAQSEPSPPGAGRRLEVIKIPYIIRF